MRPMRNQTVPTPTAQTALERRGLLGQLDQLEKGVAMLANTSEDLQAALGPILRDAEPTPTNPPDVPFAGSPIERQLDSVISRINFLAAELLTTRNRLAV